jgi:hypothetical protein
VSSVMLHFVDRSTVNVVPEGAFVLIIANTMGIRHLKFVFEFLAWKVQSLIFPFVRNGDVMPLKNFACLALRSNRQPLVRNFSKHFRSFLVLACASGNFCPNMKRYPLSRIWHIQGDQKVSVHLMITVQKTRKNILNSFSHLP